MWGYSNYSERNHQKAQRNTWQTGRWSYVAERQVSRLGTGNRLRQPVQSKDLHSAQGGVRPLRQIPTAETSWAEVTELPEAPAINMEARKPLL